MGPYVGAQGFERRDQNVGVADFAERPGGSAIGTSPLFASSTFFGGLVVPTMPNICFFSPTFAVTPSGPAGAAGDP